MEQPMMGSFGGGFYPPNQIVILQTFPGTTQLQDENFLKLMSFNTLVPVPAPEFNAPQQIWGPIYPPAGFPLTHIVSLPAQPVASGFLVPPPPFVVGPVFHGQINLQTPSCFLNQDYAVTSPLPPTVIYFGPVGSHFVNPIHQNVPVGQFQDPMDYMQSEVSSQAETLLEEPVAVKQVSCEDISPKEPEEQVEDEVLAQLPVPREEGPEHITVLESVYSVTEEVHWIADAPRRVVNTTCNKDCSRVAREEMQQEETREETLSLMSGKGSPVSSEESPVEGSPASKGSAQNGPASSSQKDTRNEWKQAKGRRRADRKKVSPPPKRGKWMDASRFCRFCKSNREQEAFYYSHALMDENGVITCPILRMHVCPACNATGDNAHTRRYCPLNIVDGPRMVGIRNSSGGYSISKY